MALNTAAAYIMAKKSRIPLFFSKTVTTTTVYLNGPGGAAGDGFYLPADSLVYGFSVYDGNVRHTALNTVEIEQNHRICLHAKYDGSSGSYTVYLRVDDENSDVYVTGVDPNTTLYATVDLIMREE